MRHATKVLTLPTGENVATCSCGWLSTRNNDATVARNQGNLHVVTQLEAARKAADPRQLEITPAPAPKGVK